MWGLAWSSIVGLWHSYSVIIPSYCNLRHSLIVSSFIYHFFVLTGLSCLSLNTIKIEPIYSTVTWQSRGSHLTSFNRYRSVTWMGLPSTKHVVNPVKWAWLMSLVLSLHSSVTTSALPKSDLCRKTCYHDNTKCLFTFPKLAEHVQKKRDQSRCEWHHHYGSQPITTRN